MKYINTVLKLIIYAHGLSSGYFGDTVPTFELEVNIFLGGGAVFFCLRCVLSFGWGTLPCLKYRSLFHR